MIGSITLSKGCKTTEQFLTIGYYDTEKELQNAVWELTQTFTKLNVLFEVNYYVRKDKYIAYYITLK